MSIAVGTDERGEQAYLAVAVISMKFTFYLCEILWEWSPAISNGCLGAP
jgi:hypothetical protein